MNSNSKPCLVACSVLREEIEHLREQGELEVELFFVSKYFHVDYAQIEKNLRPVLKRAIGQYPENVILVYGDLCLGMDNEMKKLAKEYGIVKIEDVPEAAAYPARPISSEMACAKGKMGGKWQSLLSSQLSPALQAAG